MGSIVNGRALDHYWPEQSRETGLAVAEAEPLYKPSIANGSDPYDLLLDPNLVLYLPAYFLKGNKFKTVDRYRHTCTVTGALWQPDSRLFDGNDDKITIPASTALNIRDAVTLMFWIKETSQAVNDYLFSRTTLGGSTKCVFYENPANTLRFYIDTADGAKWVNTGTLSTATWYMITGAYDKDGGANNLRIYHNKTAGTPATHTGSIDDLAALDVYIGCLGLTAPAAFFDGRIGEIWYFSRALTATEVGYLYDVTKWRYV